MTHPEMMLLVRFESELSYDEVLGVVDERLPEFAALEGLVQKYYLQDPETEEFAGMYLWRSAADLAEYKESELRATIGKAYKTVGEPRVEVYRVLKPLRP